MFASKSPHWRYPFYNSMAKTCQCLIKPLSFLILLRYFKFFPFLAYQNLNFISLNSAISEYHLINFIFLLAPEPPKNISVIIHHVKHVQVKWIPPDQLNGINQYRVCILSSKNIIYLLLKGKDSFVLLIF